MAGVSAAPTLVPIKVASKVDTDAMKQIATWASKGGKKFPTELHDYLKSHPFMVRSSGSELPSPQPYRVFYDNEKIYIEPVRAATSDVGFKFDGLFVPVVPRQGPPNNNQAITTFPRQGFVTVDLEDPGECRVVVTVQLSGCCFVVGYDKETTTLRHLGHAQPTAGGDVSHSKELQNHFNKAPLDTVFDGKKLKKVKTIGGYESEIVHLLGWRSGGKLFVAVKTPTNFDVLDF